MTHLLERLSRALYITAGVVLMALAVALQAVALTIVGSSLLSLDRSVATQSMLDAIGLIVLGVASLEIAKYLFDEEVFRDRQLHRADEARRTLNKFMTTIIIALSLEGLVFVFEARTHGEGYLISAAVILLVDTLMFVGLALFQWLIRRAETIQVPRPPGAPPGAED